MAVALDSFDNPIVAEGINRVSFYFPEMYYRHAASYAAGPRVRPEIRHPECWRSWPATEQLQLHAGSRSIGPVAADAQ